MEEGSWQHNPLERIIEQMPVFKANSLTEDRYVERSNR
jgi:hypothetical protein